MFVDLDWPLNASRRLSASLIFLLPARRSKRGTCYGNVAGWLDVTRRYCIKKAKSILKLSRPPGSHIILVSSDPCPATWFQWEAIHRGR